MSTIGVNWNTLGQQEEHPVHPVDLVKGPLPEVSYEELTENIAVETGKGSIPKLDAELGVTFRWPESQS